MNTAINYDEQPFQGEVQENFAEIIQPMLASWLDRFRLIENNPEYIPNVLPELGNVACMALLPALGNIPVDQTIIEGFREIFKITRHNILESPACTFLTQEERNKYERSNMRLAKAITVLDIANDQEIAEIFTSAEG